MSEGEGKGRRGRRGGGGEEEGKEGRGRRGRRGPIYEANAIKFNMRYMYTQ